jgi:anti-anti-sigma factor
MLAQPHPVDQDILIIEADDSINDDVTERIVNELIESINQRNCRKIILDCERLEFLSSFGLSLMLRLRHATNAIGGEVKVTGLSVVLSQIFEMSKVGGLFKIYFDVNAARTSFLSEKPRAS